MPTAKDITALRKNGQLADAFALGTELLTAEPDNIWTRRAMGWVRYERLKAVVKTNTSDEFLDEWHALAQLVAHDPAAETMLTNQALWQGISHLYAIGVAESTHSVLNAIFGTVQTWTIERPSELYSALLKAVLKTGKQWPDLGGFLQWWQLTNLLPVDYLPVATEQGDKIMALAEQAYIALAKRVLQNPDPESVNALIGELETLHEQHPEYQYPPYYLAKLFVATGSKEEALMALLPFARRKQNEFWIWDTMAELFADEPEKAIACLCRAVSSRTHEKFLVSARVDLARCLAKTGKDNEALTELEKTIAIRKAEGWRIEPNLQAGVEKLVQRGAQKLADNKALYQEYRSLTEDLLFADMPEQIGVVVFLNTDKKVAHFNVSRTVSGHFKYEGRLSRIQPGDFVALRLEQRSGKEGKFWVPLSVKKTDRTPAADVFKTFSGTLKRVEGKEFGFVNDIFIPPNLYKSVGDTTEINGAALWVYDKTKDKHSWRAFRVGT